MYGSIHWFNNRKEISSIKFVYHHCLSMMWRLHRFLFSTRQLSRHLPFLRRLISYSLDFPRLALFQLLVESFRTRSYVASRVLAFETCLMLIYCAYFSPYIYKPDAHILAASFQLSRYIYTNNKGTRHLLK